MTTPIEHEGEQAVQRRAREGGEGWGSPMFGPKIPLGFDAFLRDQRMLILGAVDDAGAAWSTIVTGQPGFADTAGDETVIIGALPAPGDPLREAFEAERDLGILAIEPQTRRRIRLNGKARRDGERLIVRTEQVLGNCPKYIQTRELEPDAEKLAAGEAVHGEELTADQQKWIAQSDTFFIASHARGHGADSSHRGGPPGFVEVTGPNRLNWPDYFGNSFYMTLGNMQLNPACGLLFLDWETGSTLQLTGRGRIDWDTAHADAVPGALRMVEFDVERVVQIAGATPLRWRFEWPSRFNPPHRGGTGGEDASTR